MLFEDDLDGVVDLGESVRALVHASVRALSQWGSGDFVLRAERGAGRRRRAQRASARLSARLDVDWGRSH